MSLNDSHWHLKYNFYFSIIFGTLSTTKSCFTCKICEIRITNQYLHVEWISLHDIGLNVSLVIFLVMVLWRNFGRIYLKASFWDIYMKMTQCATIEKVWILCSLHPFLLWLCVGAMLFILKKLSYCAYWNYLAKHSKIIVHNSFTVQGYEDYCLPKWR